MCVVTLFLNGKNKIKDKSPPPSTHYACITSKKLTAGSPKNKYCVI